MDKKTRANLLVLIDIAAVLIIIGTIILGVNLFKNRWHRINFTLTSVEVKETSEFGEYKYHVTVKGSAKTWFYDFNTYEFNLISSTAGKYSPANVDSSDIIVANHKDNGTFEFSFETDSTNEIKEYIFKAENIYIDGSEKQGTDIRLFMSDYADLIPQK